MLRKTSLGQSAQSKPQQRPALFSNVSHFSKERPSQANKDYFSKRNYFYGLSGTQPILVPNGSKEGDEEVASIIIDDDVDNRIYQCGLENATTPLDRNINEGNVEDESEDGGDPEERKETEQLPLTKDLEDFNLDKSLKSNLLFQQVPLKSQEISGLQFLDQAQEEELEEYNLSDHCEVEEMEEMKGIEREFNDQEKTVAQNLLRRSVVRKKLNWSQQFNQAHKKRNNRMEEVQRQFQETQQLNLKAFTSTAPFPPSQKRHNYQMSQNFIQSAPLIIDLILGGKDLKFLPANVLSANLKIIDLSDNQLQSLPTEICSLKHLEKLNLDQNQLGSLPSELWLLSNLTSLSARNNQLKELPFGFQTMTKLENLLVNDNKIRRLPERIGQLMNLKKLFLHHNLFQDVPIELGRLQKLKEFSLEWLIYLNPPMPKIMRDSKGQLIIEQMKTFCRQFTPEHLHIKEALESEYRSFGDFLVYFHQIRPQDINNIQFGMKKRGLVHQLCINGHTHLLENLVQPGLDSKKPTTSSHIIQDFIDLNIKDKEGSTPIFIALRSNNQEMIEFMTGSSPNASLNRVVMSKINMDLVSSKTGCPLHLCILKHRFDLATLLINQNKANPHITNTNGSNAMHILFANFCFDSEQAEALALTLLHHRVDSNLVDNNGLSPIHVAIKKKQTKALQFAQKHNQSVKMRMDINKRADGSGLPCMSNYDQVFNFNVKGKKGYTPLHYTILKANHDAFFFFLNQNLVDVHAKDDQSRTARSHALINSSFYKVLYKYERNMALKLGAEKKVAPKENLISQFPHESLQAKWKRVSMRNQQARSVDLRGKFTPLEQSQKLRVEGVQLFKSRDQLEVKEERGGDLHFNLNRRCMVKAVELSSAYNSVGSKNVQKRQLSIHKPNFINMTEKVKAFPKQGSPNGKEVTLDRVQTKKMLEQISGGLSSHIQMLAQQEVRNRLMQQSQVQSFTNYCEKKEIPKPEMKETTAKEQKPKGSLTNHNRHASSGPNSGTLSPRFINNYYIQQEINHFYPNLKGFADQMHVNINVNLNINISIPPSPKSTKGNGSRIETLQSHPEDHKESTINRAKEPLQNRRSLHEGEVARELYYAQAQRELVNESMRKEDLSVIDDEVSIQNQMNLPSEQRPNNSREGRTSHLLDMISQQNISHLAVKEMISPKALQTTERNQITVMEQRQFKLPLSPPLNESSIKKRPRREPNSSQKQDPSKQHLDTLESSFQAKIEENTKKKIRMQELNSNIFLKEFQIVLNEDYQKVNYFERYAILYKLLAMARVPSKKKEVMQVFEVLVELQDNFIQMDLIYIVSLIDPSDLVFNDFLPALLTKVQQQEEKKLHHKGFLDYECINAMKVREIKKKRVLEKFPSKSHKLHLYLRKQKTSCPVPAKGQRSQPPPVEENKYITNGSDTIEEVFDINATERNMGLNQEILKEVLSSSTAKMKQVLSPHLPKKDNIPPVLRQDKAKMANPHQLIKVNKPAAVQSKNSKGVQIRQGMRCKPSNLQML